MFKSFYYFPKPHRNTYIKLIFCFLSSFWFAYSKRKTFAEHVQLSFPKALPTFTFLRYWICSVLLCHFFYSVNCTLLLFSHFHVRTYTIVFWLSPFKHRHSLHLDCIKPWAIAKPITIIRANMMPPLLFEFNTPVKASVELSLTPESLH